MSVTESPALIAQGYRRARVVTRHHAKSFFFASYLLFGQRKKAAFALYAFCRRLDDLVDAGESALEGSPLDLPTRLARARERVAQVYLSLPELASKELGPPSSRQPAADAPSPWEPSEFAALRHSIHLYRIPEQPFQDLISGMEMDLTKQRYETWEELELYCYRVAGVVGLMLTPVLGCEDERAVEPAADLGRAMQLTNILRDVREDLERDRVYLPAEELRAFGLTEDDLRRGQVDARWRDFMRFQIQRARAYYARAAGGVKYLTGFGSQRMVRLMGGIYGDILRDIEARDYDVFSGRAHTTKGRKLALAAAAFVRPRAVLREADTALPLLAPSAPLLSTGTGGPA
ncbi:phytoene/squalene synthase family protein [Corallococcus praedator]|uniref:Phytoene/squalene synthase family protein n=1 Tax=Corallococcus praedator TaxID=2316724 RepID=A0ABX9QPN7_9BACT|nr:MULTISPECIES: squalene/phytoene synthase family protein [Corallococcus]RKH15713.1 phytoene/squalene synthase family protein [Corallococcus sp. CA047B]RKH33628.1 phytoene/squalene synthase family protein [Corallococcus sp. CA031C]RKI14796.1 phytoene/squalene synthase family protein [Corallococcus praedator]